VKDCFQLKTVDSVLLKYDLISRQQWQERLQQLMRLV